ncbi:MAG: YbaB/EbfC family nucleoid-associated protein [Candidatus Cloacimonadaceae bacterium]|nr:YbaB/EbfC family nucleoid-associated protein [Candidatus Cloacimonadaceae bacterium]
MLPGGKNMKDLMKQAQRMQQEMMKQQEELENQIFEASSGGGMVKVSITGKYELKGIKIDPQAVDPEDVEMLEDLIVAAFLEAHNKASTASNDSMSKLTGGMKIPGLF